MDPNDTFAFAFAAVMRRLPADEMTQGAAQILILNYALELREVLVSNRVQYERQLLRECLDGNLLDALEGLAEAEAFIK